jgi:transcriptional regulator with PAS, ATPase and Fis domain
VDIQQVKQRFGIVGNSPGLNRAISTALQVAPTDLSVLITGESGTGKEIFSQIIHQYSHRKHNNYIAVNCGAIPEGTIDSELFGHEKGAFTGAVSQRDGYFQVADTGTIFLDEVGELPLATQVRLLRVLEAGEFIRVGSSKVNKTDVRVVAATNVNLFKALDEGRFREDLYYRLNTVPITIPPLRERRDDISLLFRKFASESADKYRMPPLRLDDGANALLTNYRWPGNIRQLKNVAEHISVVEQSRLITSETLANYLPDHGTPNLPAVINKQAAADGFANEREMLYKILFDMKNEVSELKKIVLDILENGAEAVLSPENSSMLRNIYSEDVVRARDARIYPEPETYDAEEESPPPKSRIEDTHEIIEESLSLGDKEKELIAKALERHGGKRKLAASELGISERTLYRKIKEYGLQM